MLIPFETLFKKYQIKPDGILHLGANEGQEARIYRMLGVARVVWVEAIPETFQKLHSYVHRLPRNVAIQACVGDEDGKDVVFHVANNGGQSSSFLDFGTHAQEHPTVKYVRDIPMKTTRVDTLLRNQGINLAGKWLLNADLQGAELMALRGMGGLIRMFHWIYLEVNEKPLYAGCPLLPEIDSFLSVHGFRRVETEMTSHGWGDALFCR